MATHSSALAWKIPWTEEPGGRQCLESHRAGPTERAHTGSHYSRPGLRLVPHLSPPEPLAHVMAHPSTIDILSSADMQAGALPPAPLTTVLSSRLLPIPHYGPDSAATGLWHILAPRLRAVLPVHSHLGNGLSCHQARQLSVWPLSSGLSSLLSLLRSRLPPQTGLMRDG